MKAGPFHSLRFNISSYTLAEQDWFTNVCWEAPNLFYILPCTFNKQVSVQYLSPPWEEMFLSYHDCAPNTRVNILHLNGCGPAPRFCPGYQGATDYSKTHSVVSDIILDLQLLWRMLADRDQQLFEGSTHTCNPNTISLSDFLTIWAD